MSYVTAVPAAPADVAIEHFARRLALETDCSDVAVAFEKGEVDFVLLHVIGSAETFARRHIPGAIHLRHADISEQRMAQWPKDMLFVVYCAGPHCNGADKAALKLAMLGRPVKIMLGGLTGWEDEGLAFATELKAVAG
jgi:rhodanese-related sulfurtransferase